MQGDRIAVSPFARTGLPYITRPPPNLMSPEVQGSESAPPIPATEISARIEEVKKRVVCPESYSAPPGGSLRQVFPPSLSPSHHHRHFLDQKCCNVFYFTFFGRLVSYWSDMTLQLV